MMISPSTPCFSSSLLPILPPPSSTTIFIINAAVLRSGAQKSAARRYRRLCPRVGRHQSGRDPCQRHGRRQFFTLGHRAAPVRARAAFSLRMRHALHQLWNWSALDGARPRRCRPASTTPPGLRRWRTVVPTPRFLHHALAIYQGRCTRAASAPPRNEHSLTPAACTALCNSRNAQNVLEQAGDMQDAMMCGRGCREAKATVPTRQVVAPREQAREAVQESGDWSGVVPYAWSAPVE